jgi:methanesulfonate monooxygenase small subunit
VTTRSGELREFIEGTCLALDEERFDDFIALCSPEFTYRITAYSPEIRKELVWMDHDRDELTTLFANLPEHIRMQGSFMRQVSAGSATMKDQTTGLVKAVSPVAIFFTDIEGVTRLYAVGRYNDVVTNTQDGHPFLRSREMRLHTRDLSPGCHVPL